MAPLYNRSLEPVRLHLEPLSPPIGGLFKLKASWRMLRISICYGLYPAQHPPFFKGTFMLNFYANKIR